MATEIKTGKGVVLTVTEKPKANNKGMAWNVVVQEEGKEKAIIFYDSKGEFKDCKAGDVIEYEYSPSTDGNILFIHRPGSSAKYSGGGGGRGKSPEELAQSLKLMVLSYSKDFVLNLYNVHAGSVEDRKKMATEAGLKFYPFLEMERAALVSLINKTTNELLAIYNGNYVYNPPKE